MRSASSEILYIGKAANLKRRVSSYFTRPHDSRISKLVSEIKRIDHIKTDTAIEALILESDLIKKHQPPFNIKEKDDKSFLYIEITKDKFPRVILVRGKDPVSGERFGPFTSASSTREALKIIRKIFPFSTHPNDKIGHFKKPCFEAQIGLCPGTCVGAISRSDYAKTIRYIKSFLNGKKDRLIKNLTKEMLAASKALEFERANSLKRKIFSLQHIHDVALISKDEVGEREVDQSQILRIEGYDISNISGKNSVGSMVVFSGGAPNKSEYRKFKIKSLNDPDDPGMMREMLSRRFSHREWTMPNLILVDGGITQINAARSVLYNARLKIPIIGMVKGPERKRADILGDPLPEGIDIETLIRVRDEAHRFAISYHRALRGREFLK